MLNSHPDSISSSSMAKNVYGIDVSGVHWLGGWLGRAAVDRCWLCVWRRWRWRQVIIENGAYVSAGGASSTHAFPQVLPVQPECMDLISVRAGRAVESRQACVDRVARPARCVACACVNGNGNGHGNGNGDVCC